VGKPNPGARCRGALSPAAVVVQKAGTRRSETLLRSGFRSHWSHQILMEKPTQLPYPSKRNRASSKAGFSLLEVIVATAIVALVFVSMMEIFSSGLRTEGKADEYATAMQHATRVMNDLWVNTRQAQTAQFDGRFEDGATWHASVDVFRSPGEALDSSKDLPFEKMLLRVEVAWGPRGSEKTVQIQSIKNVLKGSSKS